MEETLRLKALGDTEPAGVLAVSDDLDPDRAEGSELTYLHGVATTADLPTGLDVIEVPAGTWGRLPDRGPAPGRVAGGLGGDGDDMVPLPALAAAARRRSRLVGRMGPWGTRWTVQWGGAATCAAGAWVTWSRGRPGGSGPPSTS